MPTGGGDKLARGFSSAQFGPNTTVSDEKWKDAFGEEGLRKLNAMDEKERQKLVDEAEAQVKAVEEQEKVVRDPTNLPIPFRAVQDRIIVSRIEEDEKVGRFYVPDESKEKPAEAIVVAVGPGKYVNGELQKPNIFVGERVVFGKFSGAEVKVGFEQYLVLREEDIFLVKEVVLPLPAVDLQKQETQE
jgi:chaperonin GroES